MLRYLGALPRRIRWALQQWSSSADREFHDTLFTAQRYDPFTFAYPGYITICRFADLAAERLDGVQVAVDLGCGPGEITCELARRRPDITFIGVDHSAAAVARAREHAAALQLTNVTFDTGDISSFAPRPLADIVLMFDAFHHLLDPAAFVRRLGTTTSRFLLIEPAGDWLGGWERTLDLDWIVPAVDTIRERIVWQLGGRSGSRISDRRSDAALPVNATTEASPGRAQGEPVEHRYTLDDFKQFFDGFGLDVRGTIAGVESYPPNPYGRAPLRDEIGQITYELLKQVEGVLTRHALDLHAKHWAIYAERGAPHVLRTPRPIDPRDPDEARELRGPYDVEYTAYDGPRAAPAAATIVASLTFRNIGWRTWSSSDPASPVFASYHWLEGGVMVIEDGVRTPLPHTVAPGGSCEMTCRIETPRQPGRYTLAIDLVEEGVTWFSAAGARLMKIDVTVRAT